MFEVLIEVEMILERLLFDVLWQIVSIVLAVLLLELYVFRQSSRCELIGLNWGELCVIEGGRGCFGIGMHNFISKAINL
jgi:hypothetical protein